METMQTLDCFDLELVDLGDATEETRACSPLPLYIDNLFGYGVEDRPWQC